MLEKFGLSNYENKVYMKLLELGLSDARTISNKSKVPYGRIYDVLESLNSQKLIIEQNGRPKKYMVVEPSIVMETLIDQQKRKVEILTKECDLTVQKLNRLYESKPKEKLVWKVAIGDDLFNSYVDLIQEARSEFCGYVEVNGHSMRNIEETNTYLAAFDKLISKNVKVRILLGVEDESILEQMLEANPKISNFIGSIEMRITSVLTYPFTIIDNEKVILKVVNPVYPEEMLAGVYLRQKELANTLLPKFESLWDSSQKLKISLSS